LNTAPNHNQAVKVHICAVEPACRDGVTMLYIHPGALHESCKCQQPYDEEQLHQDYKDQIHQHLSKIYY
jgi:hypothetical protein